MDNTQHDRKPNSVPRFFVIDTASVQRNDMHKKFFNDKRYRRITLNIPAILLHM